MVSNQNFTRPVIFRALFPSEMLPKEKDWQYVYFLSFFFIREGCASFRLLLVIVIHHSECPISCLNTYGYVNTCRLFALCKVLQLLFVLFLCAKYVSYHFCYFVLNKIICPYIVSGEGNSNSIKHYIESLPLSTGNQKPLRGKIPQQLSRDVPNLTSTLVLFCVGDIPPCTNSQPQIIFYES